jgi:hypothetical protein
MTNEELKALVKKNPISVGCGALSLLFAVGLYFRSDAIPKAEEDLGTQTAEAERLALNVKNSDRLKEQFDALTAHNKAIEARMVRVSQQAKNAQFFYKLFADTGVKQVDFRQMTTQANMPKGGKTAFIPVTFSLSVTGGYPQILDFLRQLEGGTHYAKVLTASLAGGAATRSAPLTLTLTLELLGLP